MLTAMLFFPIIAASPQSHSSVQGSMLQRCSSLGEKISKSLHSVITWKPLQADLRDCFRAVCPGTCSWEMNQSFPSILFLMVLLLAAVRAANWQLTEGLLSPRDRKIPVTCGQCWACTLCLLPITETETMVSSVRGRACDGEGKSCF